MKKSVLKVINACVKVEWVEREEELSVICIQVVVKGKRGRSNDVGPPYCPKCTLVASHAVPSWITLSMRRALY